MKLLTTNNNSEEGVEPRGLCCVFATAPVLFLAAGLFMLSSAFEFSKLFRYGLPIAIVVIAIIVQLVKKHEHDVDPGC